MEYQYPLDQDWSTDEIIDAIDFFQTVEKAYEKGIEREQFMVSYRRFKEIVPGKSQERNICKEFEELSGYSPYKTIKTVKDAEPGQLIKMK
ncbi:UPF0223 family protein [Cytobacillus purgationiresistens]|uniref:UPF0223 protein J2S17_004323 n=1 Tax=Cytobacillus purgationiresistens TaxID=863449 RepID=A0ABU0AME6_9BACI|nr:UPF0223 family protein [Cytobacillus purgationiresistens]MDQ0272431.1 uncharacterized protein YktA (UPF0223 family) [Cytobacillus purgationiresistens]